MSFDPAFATGASGRGSSARVLASVVSRTTTYDFLANGLSSDMPRLAKPILRVAEAVERRLLTPENLEASRTGGVVAAALRRTDVSVEQHDR